MMNDAGISSTKEGEDGAEDASGQKEISFEQFAAIAALSEKVAALDDTMKGVIDDMNFEALEVRVPPPSGCAMSRVS